MRCSPLPRSNGAIRTTRSCRFAVPARARRQDRVSTPTRDLLVARSMHLVLARPMGPAASTRPVDCVSTALRSGGRAMTPATFLSPASSGNRSPSPRLAWVRPISLPVSNRCGHATAVSARVAAPWPSQRLVDPGGHRRAPARRRSVARRLVLRPPLASSIRLARICAIRRGRYVDLSAHRALFG
jgi:hypothetical protein